MHFFASVAAKFAIGSLMMRCAGVERTGSGEVRPGGNDGPVLPQNCVSLTFDMPVVGPVQPSTSKKGQAEGAGDAPQLPRYHPGVIVDKRG